MTDGPSSRLAAAVAARRSAGRRAPPELGLAARWLLAAGYFEAAAELARAATRFEVVDVWDWKRKRYVKKMQRGAVLPGFWSERRASKLAELVDGEQKPQDAEPWDTGALLMNAGKSLFGSGMLLSWLFPGGRELPTAHAVRIRRALAVLLVAVDDARKELDV